MEPMLNIFGVGNGDMRFVQKRSIRNQFYSDLVTPLENKIDVPGTSVHVFYALKMGEKYEARQKPYPKAIITRANLNQLPRRGRNHSMKVLVYGAGVIGCYLTHVLCEAGNDVTLLARGNWKSVLETKGLTIRHHLQRKTTTDYPHVIGQVDFSQHYDVVFSVMSYHQVSTILDDLAAVNADTVILVGNNLSAPDMERYLKTHAGLPGLCRGLRFWESHKGAAAAVHGRLH